MYQVTTHPFGGGCYLKVCGAAFFFHGIYKRTWPLTYPSSSHLIRGSLKTYCCMWRRWLWWVLLPFNCRYIRDSGRYICCYCGEETSLCGTDIQVSSAPLQKDISHYSKRIKIRTTSNWWTGGGNMNIYNSLEATNSLWSYANIFIRKMFHLNRKEYMICERRSRNTYLYVSASSISIGKLTWYFYHNTNIKSQLYTNVV